MNRTNHLTVQEVAARYSREDEYYLFGQFLDDFQNEEHNKYALIKDEPQYKEDMELFSCILAATVHKLANDNSLPVPQWVYDKKYIMPDPVYAFDTHIAEFRSHLENTSPVEFKQRNLLLGDNILSRV